MPSESQRIRMQAWSRERTPIAELGSLLRRKTVPLHDHYVWYFLGSTILVTLATQVVTGILLVTYYEPSVPDNPAAAGAHESVRRIVETLPNGWWIRSVHHWSAHLMIAAVLLHLLSTLLMKAYRRPRELLWWSGLVLFGLTLAAGFTGYLLPWNSLSFAATRVGGGIAAATPVAGPFIHELLMGGPDVTGLTLTRFYGLHVVVIPLLILTTVGLHVILVMYHGSSVPPSARRQADAGRPALTVQFWPEFALRDFRLAVLVSGVLMTIAFVLPPPVGTRADPMAPTPAHIKPEWYFFPVFKMLKLLPTRALGLENLELGVVAMALIGATLFALPLLDTEAAGTSASRRRVAIRQRVLLIAGALLGWAATTPPARLLLAEYWPGAWQVWRGTAVTWAPVVVGLAWLAAAMWIERRGRRNAGGPATLFGWVLASCITGYTFWEGFGAAAALAGLGLLWVLLLVVLAASGSGNGVTQRLCRVAPVVLIVGALLSTVALGGLHQESGGGMAEAVATTLKNREVPAERRSETAGRLAAGLCACLFLLAVTERRIHLQRKIREMGLAA